MIIKNIKDLKEYLDSNHGDLLINIVVTSGSYFARYIRTDDKLMFSLEDNDLAIHNITVKEILSIKNNIITVNLEDENHFNKAYITLYEYKSIELDDVVE